MNHNFIIGPTDTDSISFTKPDMTPFSKEEIKKLVLEINSISPEFMDWDDDGYFPVCIVSKAKNYILYDGKKLKIKGSAFKSSTRSIALKEFMQEIIWTIIKEEYKYEEIYNKYVKEIQNVQDIKRWATKKTLTDKVEESERTNEAKVRDALEGSEYSQGEKFYVFYKEDDSLCLVENFKGEYNKKRLLKNLYDCSKVFETILNPFPFTNLTLKKNKELLENIK